MYWPSVSSHVRRFESFTGITPAPKVPALFATAEPSNLRVPNPSLASVTQACEPVAPPVALPSAIPKTMSLKPELPSVLVKCPPHRNGIISQRQLQYHRR
jgi:hypothetical protein